MSQIIVYAKTNNTKIFIGAYDYLDGLTHTVAEELTRQCRPDLRDKVYFLMGEEEYKLFTDWSEE